MTPYEELFNTANKNCIAQSKERAAAVAFVENIYHTLVRRWGIPEDRVSVYPSFGGYSPNLTYTLAEATVERPGGWSFGIEVVFAPPDADDPAMPVVGPSLAARIRVDFFNHNRGPFNVQAAGVEETIRPNVAGDYDDFADKLFMALRTFFSEEQIHMTTRRNPSSVSVLPHYEKASEQQPFKEIFPVAVGEASAEEMTYRREDMYDDDGR